VIVYKSQGDRRAVFPTMNLRSCINSITDADLMGHPVYESDSSQLTRK